MRKFNLMLAIRVDQAAKAAQCVRIAERRNADYLAQKHPATHASDEVYHAVSELGPTAEQNLLR